LAQRSLMDVLPHVLELDATTSSIQARFCKMHAEGVVELSPGVDQAEPWVPVTKHGVALKERKNCSKRREHRNSLRISRTMTIGRDVGLGLLRSFRARRVFI
jgi:hypothetical protein